MSIEDIEDEVKLIRTNGIQNKADHDKEEAERLEKVLDAVCKNVKRMSKTSETKNFIKDEEVSFDHFIIKFNISVVSGAKPDLHYLLHELLDEPFKRTSENLRNKNLIEESLYNILFLQKQLSKKNKFLISKFILPEFKKQIQNSLQFLDEFTIYRVHNIKKEVMKILALFIHSNLLKEVDI
jgi:hypothetical protein